MKVFLTGASGYIGGTVASALIAGGHQVTGLVRSPARAESLRLSGIEPLLGELDDNELLARAAAGADAVIHTAHADHRPSVEAIAGALRGSGKFFLHTSGAGVVADMAGGEMRTPVYDESTPVHPLPARAPRVALNEFVCALSSQDVRSVVVAPPMIYGKGAGIHADSIQIPKMIAVAKESGIAKYVGAGTNLWSCVHVADLADLYLAALERAPAGALYYADNGVENAMRDIASAISRMLGLGGHTQSLSIEEAYAVYGEAMVNLSFGSNCRVRAVRARRELGWSPSRKPLLKEIEHGAYAA